jgi:hypothetical protein
MEKRLSAEEIAVSRQQRLEGMRLQEIESNPLDAEQVAMFEMFEMEGWPHGRRRSYLLERAHHAAAGTLAAE